MEDSSKKILGEKTKEESHYVKSLISKFESTKTSASSFSSSSCVKIACVKCKNLEEKLESLEIESSKKFETMQMELVNKILEMDNQMKEMRLELQAVKSVNFDQQTKIDELENELQDLKSENMALKHENLELKREINVGFLDIFHQDVDVPPYPEANANNGN